MLNKLSVSGFKSIKDLVDFEFTNLNIIVGANGAGKSNLIQIFKMLRAMATKSFQSYITGCGGAEAFPFNGFSVTPKIEIEFDFMKNAYRFELMPTVDERFMLNEQEAYEGNWRTISSGVLESSLYDNRNEGSRFYACPGIGHYIYNEISRWIVYHFHDTSPTAAIRRSEIVEDYHVLRESGENIAPFLKHLREGNDSERDSYNQIVMAVRNVIPFFEDFRLDVVKKGEAEKVALSWKQKSSDYPFQAYHLSDGAIRFIALATALLQPELPSTIIIDEPELGLHPAAVSILAELIKSASLHTQVIIATQSPLLIDQFDFENVIVAKRQDGASTFSRLNKEDFSAWLDDYSIGELWVQNVIPGGTTHE